MYYSEKQLRLFLFVPLFVKHVLDRDVLTKDSEGLTEEQLEVVKTQTALINKGFEDVDLFLQQLKTDCNINEKSFKKLETSVLNTIKECYKQFFDKQNKAFKVPKIVTTILLSFWYFCHDIAEEIVKEQEEQEEQEDRFFIIHDKKYLFFQPYINSANKLLEPLRIMGLNTLQFNHKNLLAKGKTFNENKFYNKCEEKVDIIKNLIINI
jgi:hypothetical protein